MREQARRLATRTTAVLRSAANLLDERLRRAFTRFLNDEVRDYQLTVPNDMARLYEHMRKGDVVLVEGRLRISALVKYVTQSPWSHCALYVGDELLRRGSRLREEARARFGPLADRLVVEALIDEGVVAAPLEKYRAHNLRICRPSRIASLDLDRVIDSVVSDLGKPYDGRNFRDLALMLLSPIRVGALKTRSVETCLGSCTDLEVICSGMIGKAFQRVGFPILPAVEGGAPPRMRHHSRILPRDFDLSPNFRVIKFESLPPAPSIRPPGERNGWRDELEERIAR